MIDIFFFKSDGQAHIPHFSSPFLLSPFSFLFSPTPADTFPLFLYFSLLLSLPHTSHHSTNISTHYFLLNFFYLSFSFLSFSFFFPTYHSQIFYPFFSSLSLPPTQAQILLLDDEAERVRGNGIEIDGNNMRGREQEA